MPQFQYAMVNQLALLRNKKIIRIRVVLNFRL